MLRKVKIDVYLTQRIKKEIEKRAKALDLSLSDYMKLKALDQLREDGIKEEHKNYPMVSKK